MQQTGAPVEIGAGHPALLGHRPSLHGHFPATLVEDQRLLDHGGCEVFLTWQIGQLSKGVLVVTKNTVLVL